MKRFELLKRTGIYITTASLMAAMTLGAPAMTVFASSGSVLLASAEEGGTGEKACGTDEPAEEEEPEKEDPDGDDDDDDDDGDDDGDDKDDGDKDDDDENGDDKDDDDENGGDKDDDDENGGDKDGGDKDDDDNDDDDNDGDGKDDDDKNDDNDGGNGDDSSGGTSSSGKGNTDQDSDDSGQSDSGHSGGDAGSDGTGDTSSGSGKSGSGSGSTGENSGSGSAGEKPASGGSGDNADSGKTKENSGTGKSDNTIPEQQDNTGTENQASQTENTSTDAANPTQSGGSTSDGEGLIIPELPQIAAKPDKSKSIEERKTVLDPDENPTGYNVAASHTGTNEELIASQNIISGLSVIRDDFRFYTIEKDLAFSEFAQIVREEMAGGSRAIGELRENDALYILSEENDGWLYIESGTVRGFVKAAGVIRGEEAKALLTELQNKLSYLASLSGEKSGANTEFALRFAVETVPAGENKAFSYKRCTTKSTVVDKKYAVAENETYILENARDGSRQIGRLPQGSLCYLIMQVSEEWAYVESGNVRGFTRLSGLSTGTKAGKIVKEKGESSMDSAQELISPGENKALYYTLNSVHEGIAYSNVRTDIVRIAAECIGNPYVWGGNSLTYGCDCSGFVKTLYSMFGYNLPRVAEDQSRFGTQIPVSEAAPGDLIFFASNGYVYHVALYAGDGTTIEAYSEDRGIIATGIENRDAVWATRVIED